MSKELFRDRCCLLRPGDRMEAVAPSIPDMRWIRNTYSAFCNTHGGTIVIGLVPEGQRYMAAGVDNPEAVIGIVMDDLDCQDNVNRNLLTEESFRVLDVEGERVVVIDVPRASRRDRPVYVGYDHTNAYRRVGTRDVRMSKDEVESMFVDAITPSVDSDSTCICTTWDLDPDTVSMFSCMLDPDHMWRDRSDADMLRLAGAAYDDGDPLPTLAGLLMLGNEGFISQELPSYRLRCDIRYGDGETRVDSHDGTWSGNLLDFRIRVMDGVDRFLESMDDIDRDGVRSCFKEVLMNALVNCDYRYGGKVTVELSDEGIIVQNSGTLRTPLNMLDKGVCDPRNRNIARMFRAIGDVGSEGTGLERVSETCRRLGINGPVITESIDPPSVTVRISFEGDVEDFSDLESRVTEMIRADDRISILRISATLNVGKARVERVIEKLRSSGRLERIGGTRGRWVLE